MIRKNKIIDSELRLVFPSARNLYYDLKKEPVVKKIYEHKKIKTSLRQANIKNLIKIIKQFKLDKVFISGLAWKKNDNLKKNNEYLINCTINYPNIVMAFLNVDINGKNYDYSLKLIREQKSKSIKGYEIHNSSFQNLNERNKKKISSLFQLIKKKGKFIRLIGRHPHQTNINLSKIYINLIKDNNDKKFIITAMGGGLTNYMSLKLFKKIFKNTLFTSSVSATGEFIENINDYLKDKVIFGTDYPFNHFKNYNQFLKLIEKLDITKEKKNMIMYNNAKKKL